MKLFYFFAVVFIGSLTTISAIEPNKSSCLEKEKALTLLETAETLLTKATDSFPSCREEINSTDQSECGSKKPLAYIEISKKLISDVRENFPTCAKPIEKDDKDEDDKNKDDNKDDKGKDDKDKDEKDKDDKDKDDKDKDDKNKDVKYRDCYEILRKTGSKENGVYTIWTEQPENPAKPLLVYCDMQTDDGGWTVIQRRGKFPVQEDFQKDWESYKNGFGNLSTEFWLGNENIRVLCLMGCEIRFDLHDEKGEKGFALYQSFKLTGINYHLNISGYTGNVGDSMGYHNGNDFSTRDKGRTERARIFKAGWWHRYSDFSCNLNGIYLPGKSGAEHVNWFKWRQYNNLASVEMKVRPK